MSDNKQSSAEVGGKRSIQNNELNKSRTLNADQFRTQRLTKKQSGTDLVRDMSASTRRYSTTLTSRFPSRRTCTGSEPVILTSQQVCA